MPTASELESQLNQLIGKYPGFGGYSDVKTFDVMRNYLRQLNPAMPADEFQHLYTKSAEQATKLIRDWMIAKEVDPNVAWKQSTDVLQRAYKAGDAYLTAIKNNAANQRVSKKFGNTRGGRPVDIDLDLLNEPIIGNIAPVPVAPATISAADIRKAVEQVAGPEIAAIRRMAEKDIRLDLDAAIKGFGPQIDWKIEHEVSKLQLGQHMTSEITRIAEIAAKQMAADLIPHRIELRKPNGEIKELDHTARHEKFDRVLRWLLAGCNVYIVGQKGTGKTHMSQQLRDALRIALNRPDYEAYFIDQSLTKYDVKGFKGPTGEYVGTLVREAVEKGHLMVIDEGDMWAAAALGALNSILANDFGSFPDKVVKVHPDFRCVLCANTFGHGADRQYNGRNPLDVASLDRFRYVIMGYDKKLERLIYGGQNDAWMEYVWRLRDACHQTGNSDMEPSMRAIDAGIKGLQVGLTIDEIMEDVIWKGAAQDKQDKILHAAGDPPRRLTPPPLKVA